MFIGMSRQTSPLNDAKGNEERAKRETTHTKGSVSTIWLVRSSTYKTPSANRIIRMFQPIQGNLDCTKVRIQAC